MNLLNFYIPEWFWVAFNLLVLIVILKKVLWDRVRKVLQERQDMVAKSEQDAQETERLRAEIEQLRAEFDKDMEARTIALMKEARTNAGKEYDRIVTQAEEKAGLIVSAAKTKARQEQDVILVEIKKHIAATAIEAAGLLLRTNMDSERNNLLLDDFLSEGEKSA